MGACAPTFLASSSLCFAAPSFSLLHLSAAFHAGLFVEAPHFQLLLQAVKLHFFLEGLKSLLQVVILDFHHDSQGYPPFLFSVFLNILSFAMLCQLFLSYFFAFSLIGVIVFFIRDKFFSEYHYYVVECRVA